MIRVDVDAAVLQRRNRPSVPCLVVYIAIVQVVVVLVVTVVAPGKKKIGNQAVPTSAKKAEYETRPFLNLVPTLTLIIKVTFWYELISLTTPTC